MSETLNSQQLKAVTTTSSKTLIVAGAGSGKTRVLVHRCAWLMQHNNLEPHTILAVTFTNKASQEMRHRIEQLIQQPLYGMWCGTFHSLCHRMLRQNFQAADLQENFQILDQDDQQKLIKKIQKSAQLDEAKWPVKKTQTIINSLKEQGKRAKDTDNNESSYQQTITMIYQQYEAICTQAGLVDFAEILLRTVELLENNPDIQASYHQQFKHILIDEFQDTNSLQYRWIKAMTSSKCDLTAVGDDDQSIYSWRGAKVAHLLKFAEEFAAETIRLEQNYRSTNTILKAANNVIQNNSNRMSKTLWTEQLDGENIDLYQAFNEIDEAQYICQQIGMYLQQGINQEEIAVLYRSNAQSRLIEEQLTRANIGYKIYGGLRFFERAEIKDAISYLRLVARKNDDGAFERIINTPTRGIGHATMETIREQAKTYQTSLWEASKSCISTEILASKAHNCLLKFIALIEELTKISATNDLTTICQHILDDTGLVASLANNPKNASKIDNLEELVNATRGYTATNTESNIIIDFLNNIALDQNPTHDNNTNVVQLMTLHAAKGLEFNYVFLAGVEEGLFPHKMCLYDKSQLEEERRLCYVGMTRAMNKLHISYAESRRSNGFYNVQSPSRFILEIPSELINPIKMSGYSPSTPKKTITPTTNQTTSFYLGQKIHHEHFGEGTILNSDGQGESTRIQVAFTRYGTKWLMLHQSPISY